MNSSTSLINGLRSISSLKPLKQIKNCSPKSIGRSSKTKMNLHSRRRTLANVHITVSNLNSEKDYDPAVEEKGKRVKSMQQARSKTRLDSKKSV